MLRRIWSCAIALLLMTGMAQAATLCIDAPGVVTLTDARGNELIENGLFSAAFTVRDGALYALGDRGAYQLYDARGQALGDVEFSMIDDAGDALVFRSGAYFGAMRADGQVLLPPRWTALTPDGNGGWLALEGDLLDGQPDGILHIDGDGTIKQTGVECMGGLQSVSDGRMPFVDRDGRYGAVDTTGAVAIEPAWQYMGPFSNGLAKVAGPDGMGVIDVSGRVVITATYSWLERNAAMIAAWDEGAVEIFSPRGGQRRVRLPGKVVEVALVGEYLAVTYEGRVCLYNASGKLLLQGGASMEFAPGSRGQLIASNGTWGERSQWLVNPDGGTASGTFQQLMPLIAERYAFLRMDGETYYSAQLDATQTRWDYAGSRYGLMDGRGRILIAAKYREIRALGTDRLLLVGDDRVQIADRNGAVIKTWINPEAAESSREANE